MKMVNGQKCNNRKYQAENCEIKVRGRKFIFSSLIFFHSYIFNIDDDVRLEVCWHQLLTALAKYKWQKIIKTAGMLVDISQAASSQDIVDNVSSQAVHSTEHTQSHIHHPLLPPS